MSVRDGSYVAVLLIRIWRNWRLHAHLGKGEGTSGSRATGFVPLLQGFKYAGIEFFDFHLCITSVHISIPSVVSV